MRITGEVRICLSEQYLSHISHLHSRGDNIYMILISNLIFLNAKMQLKYKYISIKSSAFEYNTLSYLSVKY